MRIFSKECKKLFSDGLLWKSLILCMLFNLFLILFYADIQQLQPSTYRKFTADLLQLEACEQKAFVSQELEKVTALFHAQYISGIEVEVDFEDAQNYPRYCTYLYDEMLLYGDVLSELEQVYSYHDFLNSIQSQQEALLSMQGTLGISAYEQRRIDKVLEDYDAMRTVEMSFIRSRGLHEAVCFFPTHILILLIALLLTAILFFREKEQKHFIMLDTMASGRERLRAAKLLALLLGILLAVGIFELENLLIFGMLYGFCPKGFLSAPLQALYGASSSALCITVGQMLLLSCIGFCLACFLIMLLILLISRWIPNMALLYAGAFMILLMEALLYFKVGSLSKYANWKWINLAALLNIQDALMSYKLLNIFGIPVSYIFAVSVFFALSVSIGMLLNIILSIESRYQIIFFSKRHRLLKRKRRHRTCGLLQHEFLKILVDSHGWLVISAVILFSVWISGTYKENLYDLEDVYYKKYITQVEGIYTEDRKDILLDELERLKQESSILEENNVLQANDSALFIIQRKESALMKCLEYAAYLEEKPGSSFVYSNGIECLFTDKNRNLLYMIFGVTAVICMMSFFWTMEYSSGVEMLQAISTCGRKSIQRKKNMFSIGMTLLVFAVLYGSFYGSIFKIYHISELSAQANSLQCLSFAPAWMSIRLFLIILFVLRMILLQLISFAVKLLSQRLHSVVEVILVSEAISSMLLLGLYIII